jgi:hypothetical protein
VTAARRFTVVPPASARAAPADVADAPLPAPVVVVAAVAPLRPSRGWGYDDIPDSEPGLQALWIKWVQR